MTSPTAAHCWAVPPAHTVRQASPHAALAAAAAEAGLPIAPAPHLEVGCHRRARGPYSGAGALLRIVVPELLAVDAELVAARATEITTMAPELTAMIPTPPQTLTNLASRPERTRFYSVGRTRSLSHGAVELLMDWARLLHPGGVVVAFADLDDADPSDREFVSLLLRRCDPDQLRVIAEASGADDPLGRAMARYARQVVRQPRARKGRPADADLAQLFIDSDGTARDPAICLAYAELPVGERASRHTARAEALAARGEPSLRLGAIPYHLERGIDPVEAGGKALTVACNDCFDLGCYEAALELAMRGRELVAGAEPAERYWNFTHKAGACLSYLEQGFRGFACFDELRRITADPDVHMNNCYMMAMLYTRHLPPGDHDEFRALEWVNTAIALADCHPDPHTRVVVGAFMRNARALVELHRGDPQCSLALVNEAIAMTDAEALADYATAIRLTPPFHEVHYNRADLLRELGDDDGALRDLDYALVLDPDHVDSLVNRVDLLLERGEAERARADIDAGLELDPGNANLLSARGSLLADMGDTDAAHASYTAALAEDPAFVPAWANRAILSYSVGRPADAVADLDHAIGLADDPWLRVNRAIALQDLDEHGRALADFDIAVAALGAEEIRLRVGARLPESVS